MGWFTKRRAPEVVDLTDMQRRGLLPAEASSPSTANAHGADTSGFVDLGSSQPSASSASSAPSASPAGDFLSGLANVGASSSGSVSDSLREARKRNLGNAEVHELKLKLEDAEYKISTLTDKVHALEAKLREKGF